jgi:hypothetical protein
MSRRYQVAVHSYGRRGIEWPRHQWHVISARPMGLKAAMALADAQPQHAVVTVWMEAETVHDNGKAPAIPDGWQPADEQAAL